MVTPDDAIPWSALATLEIPFALSFTSDIALFCSSSLCSSSAIFSFAVVDCEDFPCSRRFSENNKSNPFMKLGTLVQFSSDTFPRGTGITSAPFSLRTIYGS